MANPEAINAKITVKLRHWTAPNFAGRADGGEDGIAVEELEADDLNRMALAWLEDLYRKARWTQPFAYQDGLVQERQK